MSEEKHHPSLVSKDPFLISFPTSNATHQKRVIPTNEASRQTVPEPLKNSSGSQLSKIKPFRVDTRAPLGENPLAAFRITWENLKQRFDEVIEHHLFRGVERLRMFAEESWLRPLSELPVCIAVAASSGTDHTHVFQKVEARLKEAPEENNEVQRSFRTVRLTSEKILSVDDACTEIFGYFWLPTILKRFNGSSLQIDSRQTTHSRFGYVEKHRSQSLAHWISSWIPSCGCGGVSNLSESFDTPLASTRDDECVATRGEIILIEDAECFSSGVLQSILSICYYLRFVGKRSLCVVLGSSYAYSYLESLIFESEISRKIFVQEVKVFDFYVIVNKVFQLAKDDFSFLPLWIDEANLSLIKETLHSRGGSLSSMLKGIYELLLVFYSTCHCSHLAVPFDKILKPCDSEGFTLSEAIFDCFNGRNGNIDGIAIKSPKTSQERKALSREFIYSPKNYKKALKKSDFLDLVVTVVQNCLLFIFGRLFADVIEIREQYINQVPLLKTSGKDLISLLQKRTAKLICPYVFKILPKEKYKNGIIRQFLERSIANISRLAQFLKRIDAHIMSLGEHTGNQKDKAGSSRASDIPLRFSTPSSPLKGLLYRAETIEGFVIGLQSILKKISAKPDECAFEDHNELNSWFLSSTSIMLTSLIDAMDAKKVFILSVDQKMIGSIFGRTVSNGLLEDIVGKDDHIKGSSSTTYTPIAVQLKRDHLKKERGAKNTKISQFRDDISVLYEILELEDWQVGLWEWFCYFSVKLLPSLGKLKDYETQGQSGLLCTNRVSSSSGASICDDDVTMEALFLRFSLAAETLAETLSLVKIYVASGSSRLEKMEEEEATGSASEVGRQQKKLRLSPLANRIKETLTKYRVKTTHWERFSTLKQRG